MNWLVKEEPTHYSFDDLVRDKTTSWTGVRNPGVRSTAAAVGGCPQRGTFTPRADRKPAAPIAC